MPKTFPIRLEVEEIALGTVLRRLNEMAGIAKINLDLGHGGRKPLPAAKSNGHGNGNHNAEQVVVALLAKNGPMAIKDIAAGVGGPKSRAYGAAHQLKKKGIVESAGKGMHRLTKKAMAGMQSAAAPIALPAPTVKRGPKGRASPGSGTILLRAALDAGPVPSSDLRANLARNGMSSKSISGVLDRARKGGFIKRDGTTGLYALTARGQKLEATHG